ncbi:hypothetical protein PQU92_07760 [Asticcacaulis sp. BYS171W]|uniref:Uncharacterized protein n=1 Tax=Asticcacaulis aquaticus TaxID=2984212 RepID=A0ABT5HT87_9CAUL|nr:hypothetical protein [Asticcacaulis aquaticus]MDC7683168.1 hypothetical protein [Asticcacaulis aquaticus]
MTFAACLTVISFSANAQTSKTPVPPSKAEIAKETEFALICLATYDYLHARQSPDAWMIKARERAFKRYTELTKHSATQVKASIDQKMMSKGFVIEWNGMEGKGMVCDDEYGE